MVKIHSLWILAEQLKAVVFGFYKGRGARTREGEPARREGF